MPDWVDAIDDAALAATVDRGTLARGRDYARRGLVGPVRRLPGLISAEVSGSRRHPYLAMVRPPSGRSRARRFVGDCSCPVGEDCKHVVALILAARDGGHDLLDTRPPRWEDAIRGLVSAGGRPRSRLPPPPAGRPLALFVRLRHAADDADRTTWATRRPVPAIRVRMRPAVGDGRGGWTTTAMSWPRLASGAVADVEPGHREAAAGLYGSFLVHRAPLVPHQPEQAIPLDECGPEIWDLLRRARDAGVSILPSPGSHRAVTLTDHPATLSLQVSRATDGGARLGPALTADGVSMRVDTVAPVGEPAHGVGVVIGGPPGRPADANRPQPGTLVLARLAEPIADAVTDLLAAGGTVRIPAPDIERFAAEYSPALRRVVPVVSDGSVDLPEVGPPHVALDLTWQAPHTLTVRWAFGYPVGQRVLRAPLAPTTEDTAPRDPGVEADLLGRLPLPPSGPERAREMTRLGMLDGARFTGAGALAFVREDLPRFADLPGVEVSVTGQEPDFREAAEAPVVAVGAADRPGERDWFDLSVTVTVEGEPVPFAELFTALARGDTYLVLDTGVYLSLDAPELLRLRALIEEARGLQDRSAGDGLRINRYQADLWAELAALGVVTQQSERWVASVRAVLDAAADGPPPLPPGVDAVLRPYQLEGYRWLATLRAHGLGGILADDMGLGKTLQILTMIARAREQGERAPFLVVAPTSVVATWVQEAARFVPGLAVSGVTRTQAKSGTPIAEAADGAALVVTSYALFRLDVEAYNAVDWAGVVLDEAQAVKNHRARTYQLVRRLPTPVKIAVTGTPLENSLMELWALLSIVCPGMYPSPERFAETVARPVEDGSDPGRLDVLRRRIRPFLLRRTKEQVATDLPPKQEQVLEVDLQPKHRRVYQTHLQRERQKVLRLIDDPQRNRFAILRSLMLLRRLALDPALVDEDYAGVPASKVDVLLERVREVVDEGHRALVFSQFTGFLATVRARLDAAGIDYAYLDGRTRDRARRIAEFREGTAPLFLISLKAGGSGLTLTEADYVFLLDPWWNPAVEAQAVDRTHRIGQDKPVMVYRLVATDTIEDKVMALKARKSELFASVMADGGLPAGPLSADDVRELMSG